jgi:predicted TIM-barrel fold metal-dependent hydrolase
VLFGSYYPYFDFESALLKMRESGLDETTQKAIFADNARRLVGAAGSFDRQDVQQ